MKKKGFTLIELLAVIVILAIIALIAIPLIGNVIEKAKIGALENSVNGLVESANMYYANQTIKGEQNIEITFDFENGEQTSISKLEYKGKVYNGKLILHANGEVAVCIDDKEHYAYKNKNTDEIVSGTGTCLYDGTTGDFSSNSPLEDMKKQVAAATATSDKVLEGDTIYTLSGLVAGTMANKAGQTVTATTITESEDGKNTLVTIPQAGYYDETSQISVPASNLEYASYTLFNNSNTSTTKSITVKRNASIIIECTVRSDANQNSQSLSSISNVVKNGIKINPNYSYDDKMTLKSGMDDGSGNRMHVYILTVDVGDVLNITVSVTQGWGWFINRCIIYAPTDFIYS